MKKNNSGTIIMIIMALVVVAVCIWAIAYQDKQIDKFIQCQYELKLQR